MDIPAALGCLAKVPKYNRFDPDCVYDALGELGELQTPIRVAIARESSPALYVYSTDAPAVYDVFNSMSKPVETPENVPEWFAEPEGSIYVGPDELGIHTDVETYPAVGLGDSPEAVSKGTPAVCRFWWD